jgi:SAM-dependent methyltransferase
MDAFTGKATVYAKARPGYAPAALDFVCGVVENPGAVFADIGAGTGKFTALLAERGYTVYAVEPNADMRAQMLGRDTIHVIDGTAEATGLPDRGVDAVTCAQAFHWFDPEKFKLECACILKPGGRVFVLYNRPASGAARGYPELQWDGHGGDLRNQLEQRIASLQDFFGPGMRKEHFPNPVSYDADGWLAYMLSHSHSPRPGEETYERFVESVRAIFERKNENGLMRMAMETVVYL